MDYLSRTNKGIDKEIWPLIDEYYKGHGTYPSAINVSQIKADEYGILKPPNMYRLLFKVENLTDIPIMLVPDQESPIVLT